MLSFFCLSNIYGQYHPVDTTDAFFEDAPVFDETCYPLGRIDGVHTLHFESAALVYLDISASSGVVIDNSIRVREVGLEEFSWTPADQQEGGYVVTLEPQKSYVILGENTCGELHSVARVSTTRLHDGDLIPVSQTLWNILRPWRLGESTLNLFDYLDTHPEIPEIEKLSFLQNMMKGGAPFSDGMLNSADVLGSAKNSMKENNNGERECFCRLLKIDMGSIVTPTSSGQVDPMIHPVALGPQTMTETSKILIKRSGLIEGPAKYKALWGGTKYGGACENSPISADWGDEVDEESAEETFLRSASGNAKITVGQFCTTTYAEIGDCYCRQTLRYSYRYDSYGFTDTKTMAGWCLSTQGKESQAMLNDLGVFLVYKEDVDYVDNPNFEERTLVYADATFNQVASSCKVDFQEDKILDLLLIGYAIYSYSKGLPVILPGQPSESGGGNTSTGSTVTWEETIASLGDALWENYQVSIIKEKVEGLITEPWVLSDTCGVKFDNKQMIGTSSVTLENYEEITFELFDVTAMRIQGRTRWRATAEAASGFQLSVGLVERYNGPDGDDCCTRPAGIYAFSTQHPVHNSNTYTQEIGNMLSSGLIGLDDYFPTSPFNDQLIIDPEIEWNILIPPYDPEFNCDTEINGRSFDTEENHEEPLPVTKAAVYFDGENIMLSDLSQSSDLSRAQLLSVDGKVLLSTGISQKSNGLLFRRSDSHMPTGLYFVRLIDSNNNLSTHKIFLP
ncbi:MAG: hypothetical protein NXI08_16545 [bacterium]|nr:hypothetical protein [bacterium]